jgi:glycosyltransferase involved in cell wall biosynthesis
MTQWRFAVINGQQERPRRLAFVADRRDWALDNIAKNIGLLLGEEYDVTRFYAAEYPKKEYLFLDLFVENQFDNIHFLGRETYFKQLEKFARFVKVAMKAGVGLPSLVTRMADPVTTASVYDHLHLDDTEVAERQERFALLDAYSTSSQRLFREYIKQYRQPPVSITQDGVNLELFKPRDLERFDRYDRPLVIGWVGNSLWPRRDGKVRRKDRDQDPKGLRTLVIPAIERVRDEGLDVVSSFADRNVEWRPRESMPQYYSEIDILICSSEHEGTPNPVLEAMACGVPVISTNVGIVAEAFGPLQMEFLIRERTVDALANSIRHLYENRLQLQTLSQENLKSVHEWTWQRQVPKWRELFEKAQSNHAAHHDWKRKTIGLLAETAWRERFAWLGFYGLGRRIMRSIAIR